MKTLLAWIASLGGDALGRFGLNLIATALFARMLDPRQFGLAALTVVYIGVLYTLVSAMFEEALTQRRIVRTAHFSSALGVSLAVAVLAILCLQGVQWTLGGASHAEDAILPLLAGFSFVLLADAPISIYTALLRRQRRFHLIARANLLGHLVGTVCGLALAFNGVGAWSLLAVRLVARPMTALMLVASARQRPLPAWSPSHLRQLARFSGFHVAGVSVERMTDAVIQTLVTIHFGLGGNGYLNMAMRVVEPLRGAIGAIGHNIATSYFVRVQGSPVRLRQQLDATLSMTSLLLLPAYVGLAVTSPALILALAGPGWEPSVPLLSCLALAAAVTMPSDFLHSAISARGRADIGLYTALLDLAVVLAVFTSLSGIGLIVAGLARLLAGCADAAMAVLAGRRIIGQAPRQLVAAVWPAALHSCLMALGVSAVAQGLPAEIGSAPGLAVQVLAGVVIFFLLIGTFHRQRLLAVRALFSR